MGSEPLQVSDLGEIRLIERFRKSLPAAPQGEVWSGDDAAIVSPGAAQIVLTIDVLVENVDFDLAYADGADVGWKALAVNVSDIAAMGGSPRYAVIGMSLRPDTPVAVVDGVLEGMLEGAGRWGVALVGGDISVASEISLAVTVVGSVEHPVLRSGAEPGDAICVTGPLGGAAGGLLVLQRDIGGAPAEAMARKQLRPSPRLEEGLTLAAHGRSHAMIDISDGLLRDLTHVLDASGVGCRIEPEAVPIDPHLDDVDLGVEPLELALTGGEDFELLVVLPEANLADVSPSIDLVRIGTITGSERRVGDRNLEEWQDKGWEHLRTR